MSKKLSYINVLGYDMFKFIGIITASCILISKDLFSFLALFIFGFSVYLMGNYWKWKVQNG